MVRKVDPALSVAAVAVMVLALAACPVHGHQYMTSPTPRNNNNDNTAACSAGTAGASQATYAPGESVTVQWQEDINHLGQTYSIEVNDVVVKSNVASPNEGPGSTSVTIPNEPGDATIATLYNGYRSCADITISGACTPQNYYQDSDGDGYGVTANVQNTCPKPAGYSADGGDCDDTNPLIFPGAPEACNSVDDDCDTEIDEGLGGVTLYADADKDGYGDPATSQTGCVAPGAVAYVANADDCDDSNAEAHPDHDEWCGNSIDDDCDGTVDEADCVENGSKSPGTDKGLIFALIGAGTFGVIGAGMFIGKRRADAAAAEKGIGKGDPEKDAVLSKAYSSTPAQQHAAMQDRYNSRGSAGRRSNGSRGGRQGGRPGSRGGRPGSRGGRRGSGGRPGSGGGRRSAGGRSAGSGGGRRSAGGRSAGSGGGRRSAGGRSAGSGGRRR